MTMMMLKMQIIMIIMIITMIMMMIMIVIIITMMTMMIMIIFAVTTRDLVTKAGLVEDIGQRGRSRFDDNGEDVDEEDYDRIYDGNRWQR